MILVSKLVYQMTWDWRLKIYDQIWAVNLVLKVSIIRITTWNLKN